MSAWAAFWLCVAVYIGCECYLYDKGHDTFLWQHKTPAELELQRKAVEKAKGKPCS